MESEKTVSESYHCPKHGDMSCPICGSVLVGIKYTGNRADLLALTKRVGFRCFVGCLRVDLHDKVVDGVDCRGKVFVRAIFLSDEDKI